MAKLQPNTLIEFNVALVRRGLNQTSLAHTLRISPRYIRYMVAGKVPAYRTWQRLRDEFGFPAEAIPQHNSARGDRRAAIKTSAKDSKVVDARS